MIWIRDFLFNVRIIYCLFMDWCDSYLDYHVFAGGISTTELVNRLYNFCEVCSGQVLYSYQTQFSKRVIRSILENDGAEITALFSRQSGKTHTIAVTVGGLMIILPQLANMPMFAGDKRLEMFKDGFWVGIFAPSQHQAQITFGRMQGLMQGPHAQAILDDPDFRLSFSTSNGQTVKLTNGSFVTAISASDRSNIEGESFKFIIYEECQDISNFKIQESIYPMGSAYNATHCKIGTAKTYKGDFYEAINRNKSEYSHGVTKIRNHFEYNYKVVEKFNPKYAKTVIGAKRILGERSDAFRMAYGLEWLLSRGMFVDVKVLEKDCGNPAMERISSDKTATHCAGIDIGGGSSKNKDADSTIITVVEVDWNTPVLMETTRDEETGQDIIYLAYNTYIKDWLEISSEIAENYEEQYGIIMEYLKRFKIARLMIDSTRESSLAQRIQASVNYEVIPFVFTSKSKSELYKHLSSEISTGRAKIPTGPRTKETKEYKEFIRQMGELQKSYSGTYMVVSHPDERGAHDDYSDSWALAVYATKTAGNVDNTETKSKESIFGAPKGSYAHKKASLKNKVTGRRRR